MDTIPPGDEFLTESQLADRCLGLLPAVSFDELLVGEFVEIQEWDILSGRGGAGNHHRGNKRFRNIVSKIQLKYKGTTKKRVKNTLSKHIVKRVRDYGGRFLTEDYFEMTEPQAVRKTSQALRENKEYTWTDANVEEDDDFYEEAEVIAEQG
jgi:hypothetical protein